MSRSRRSWPSFALAAVLPLGFASPASAAPCDAPIANPITCENTKAGNPASQWDVSGSGSASIQGYATEISVDQGQIIRFKVDTPASAYHFDIYRMGYYAGMGARKVATVQPSVSLPQSQPNCLTEAATGLIDCGNWAVSGSWTVPADAVSGIYFAKLVRDDGTVGSSHIVFVVRDDDGRSEMLFQTSDATWEAYNTYGGNSLYVGQPAGRAYKVSYNRPFITRGSSPEDWVFNAEYPMVRFIERNGYNVSYFAGVDSDRYGSKLLEHKLFLSVGHDEYWSGTQRANVEAARAAGLNLAFFSANEVFWKTRYEPSTDGSATPFRTLVAYKETHANAKIDPLPTTWTGTWRDPRFSPPADGGRPENNLTGQLFMVNDGATGSISVPAADGKMRFWRNTSVATLGASATATLPNGTLGYEWDTDPDNGFRPAGAFRVSSTTVANAPVLVDYGTNFGSATAEHHMTMYKTGSSLVFGAGTVQWAWGLDSNHDRGSAAADSRMQQATVNLFADQGVQPSTLMTGLVTASPSADTTAPTSTIASPTAGSSVGAGATVTITGTAADAGGVVGGVEVSTDGGTTWHPATGRATWSYSWRTGTGGSATIKTRAVDDSGNLQTPGAGITVTIGSSSQTCPCSIFGTSATPAKAAETSDNSALEIGMKFRSTVAGKVTALRFYKGATNTGTHTGHLWTSTGTLLATATFTNETSTGWQEVTLATPVNITANTTYIASYYAPKGNYAVDDDYFTSAGVDSPPLRALKDSEDGGNGLYDYGALGTFPTSTYRSENYWVDAVFSPGTGSTPDTTPPTISSFTPAAGATGVSATANVIATFNEALDATSVTATTVTLRDSANALVPAAVTYDAATRTAKLDPSASLADGAAYTATVKGGASGVKDTAGNALAADSTWNFTTAAASPSGCPCSIWGTSAIPAKAAETTDTAALEVGVRFRPTTDGRVTALRFYKGATNTGTHTGHLWTSTGTLLAAATFTNETATGWQEVTLATPVNVTANTTYIASYYAPKGNYAVDEDYFTSAGVDSPSLRALKDGEDGGNGLYGYGALGTFPTGTYRSENYWVDVVFQTGAAPPDTTPPTITAVLATPAVDGSATVTWTTDEPADSRVDYGTSPSILGQNVSDATRATTHSVRLTGLTSGATYSFRVTSVDAAGNSMTSPAALAAPTAFSMPFTASPAAAVIESGGGTLTAGTAASLTADDNAYYQVSSTTTGTRTTSWYGGFTGLPTGLGNLRVFYTGKNSRSCTQVVAIFRWSDSTWQTLDSRAVTTTEVALASLAPAGAASNYVNAITGELRVRVRCTTTANFVASGDLLKITYTQP